MTLSDFQQQLNRLIGQFGKSAYSQARAEIIWRQVKDFDRYWWEKTVDHLLINYRQAPLQAEIGPLISDERQRLWQAEKRQNSKDAKDFFEGTYQDDDVKTICQMITKRMRGEVSDEDYAKFVEHLEHAANHNLKVTTFIRCKMCADSGIMFLNDRDGYEFAYRCICETGRKKYPNYPVYNYELNTQKGQ